jgi:hypothetical protein
MASILCAKALSFPFMKLKKRRHPMISLSYTDLLDILDDYRVLEWEKQPCNVEEFAKYVWKQYKTSQDHVPEATKKIDE